MQKLYLNYVEKTGITLGYVELNTKGFYSIGGYEDE